MDAEDLKEGLEVIDRNAKVQAQIIEDLLDISRIISGNLRLDVQRVNLAEVIEAAIAAVMPAAEAKGVRLKKVLDPLAGPVSGDPARLQQVVWNLLTNAVKFTPKGGRVQVLLERVNSHVEISVIDTGMGIRPEFLPHVFERFRQADSSTTRRHGGLGLGLAIVKQLAELHGGTVRAKSPGEGQGSTFVVSLPITVVHEAPPEKVRPKEHESDEFDCSDKPLSGIKVLVVDDEPDARQLVRRVLSGVRGGGGRRRVGGRGPAARRELPARHPGQRHWHARAGRIRFHPPGPGPRRGQDAARRGPHRLRPLRGPEAGVARRVPDARRQARGPGGTGRRRRQPRRADGGTALTSRRRDMDGPKTRSDERRPGMRILVVDDSQDTARMMRVLLRGQGYEVKLAFAGREAIEVAEGFRPEVVLLDLTLPDLSGAEVAEELRGAEGFERTAFVAVSGYGSERIPRRLRRAFREAGGPRRPRQVPVPIGERDENAAATTGPRSRRPPLGSNGEFPGSLGG